VLVLALGVTALVVLRQGPERAVVPGASRAVGSTPDADDTRGDAGSALLGTLSTALERGSRSELTRLAPTGDAAATRQLITLRANVRALRITGLSMRYVEESAPADDQPALGSDDWVADVAVTWRLRGFDAHDSTMEVPLVLRLTGDRARFVSSRYDAGQPAPLWLLDRVGVRRTPRSLVMAAVGQSTARFSRLADQAVLDVRKVLTRWRGRLVVEIPADQGQVTQVLGQSAGDYAEIAAVTTTVDRSTSSAAPVHVFVNPRVFDPLGPRGSQIVLSHEATHVATDAALSDMPTWLLEGFADYVALDHVDLPVSVTASQILAQVRRSGAPAHLPGAREFSGQNKQLGASYEAAWLACRLLGETYGERRLIAFYRASARASSTTAAFRDVLGTDQGAFTRAWRAELRRLSQAEAAAGSGTPSRR